MLHRLGILLAAAASAAVIAAPLAQERQQPTPVADLLRQAGRKISATSRTPLAPVASEPLRGIATLEPANSGRVPNYLRMFGAIPGAAKPYATAFNTLLTGGTVEPETKMAMGLQIARVLRSPYAAVHMRRLLAATERGRTLVANLESGAAARPEQAVAIGYATSLTEDVHGIDDARFRQVRGYYNDAQIVELTLTVSFFNYFTRLVEAVNLPVEQWALDSPPAPGPAARERYAARVNLISDAQMQWAAGVVNAQRQRTGPRSGDDFGLVNSQRAMNLVPDISAAWRGYTGATGADAAVSREIKLHVSFAVSMANGCRYCTLHQVQGLRRLGVSPEKLLAMAKDDSALTPRELAAVVFARKLTHTPPQITDGDYEALRREFGERGAFEVVLQTCNFAFMNRFTDNLGLPSEDEAVRTYREVYGRDWKSR